MGKNILFVLGGLGMGGVETYLVRLAKQLVLQGHRVEVVVLSCKADRGLKQDLEEVAHLITYDRFPWFQASSWLNGFLTLDRKLGNFDIVHVVDLLSLGFVRLNYQKIKFDFLSIGIYHSAEIEWWRGRKVYFRNVHLSLFDANVTATLFPSESIARAASNLTGVQYDSLNILPLGINLERYAACTPSINSKKIISIGRLVDFKTYNRNIIRELPKIRTLGDFHYFIYGDGPELINLIRLAEDVGVSDYVHFEGEVSYENLHEIFSDCFCFVGSGTTIIEASAAGVPSIVGIESIEEAVTCGFFSEVRGFSYNEAHATNIRISLFSVFESLCNLDFQEYLGLSVAHRIKSSEFDIAKTAEQFLLMSKSMPNFNLGISRCRAVISFFWSLIRFGPQALKRRFRQANVV